MDEDMDVGKVHKVLVPTAAPGWTWTQAPLLRLVVAILRCPLETLVLARPSGIVLVLARPSGIVVVVAVVLVAVTVLARPSGILPALVGPGADRGLLVPLLVLDVGPRASRGLLVPGTSVTAVSDVGAEWSSPTSPIMPSPSSRRRRPLTSMSDLISSAIFRPVWRTPSSLSAMRSSIRSSAGASKGGYITSRSSVP